MADNHVKSLFLAWSEGRLDETKRLHLQQHLQDCDVCRVYFDKMTILLEKPEPSLLPRLEADPFLPTRIRALAEERSAPAPGRRSRWLRWSFSGAMLLVAATIGVYVGKGLSNGTPSYGDSEIVSAYYDALSQSGFADDWEYVIEDESESNGSSNGNGG